MDKTSLHAISDNVFQPSGLMALESKLSYPYMALMMRNRCEPGDLERIM
jgi:hypothetical protein